MSYFNILFQQAHADIESQMEVWQQEILGRLRCSHLLLYLKNIKTFRFGLVLSSHCVTEGKQVGAA